MTDRISLIEAYDNRDVIAQLVRDREDLREIKEILANLPNPDLTNCVLKTGNQTIAGVKTFTDQVVLSGGMDLNALGALTINGDLLVDGDIVQSGAAYETHAEQIFSHNDYLVMRDGAVNALPAGSYSGLQVKKYDGTNDCRLVVDDLGVARVGDINDEKPLMVRDEAADLTNGNILLWDGINQKAISAGVATGDLVHGSGNIGDDTHPVKIAGGDATAVSKELLQYDVQAAQNFTLDPTYFSSVNFAKYQRVGRMVFVGFNATCISGVTYSTRTISTGLPKNALSVSFYGTVHADGDATSAFLEVDSSGNLKFGFRAQDLTNKPLFASIFYITSE